MPSPAVIDDNNAGTSPENQLVANEAEASPSAGAAGTGTGESSGETAKYKYGDIISWLDSGTHFVILDPDRFMTEVMVSLYLYMNIGVYICIAFLARCLSKGTAYILYISTLLV